MDQLQQLKQWYRALPIKEQWMVSGTSVLIVSTLFYLLGWEPLHLGLEQEQQKQTASEWLGMAEESVSSSSWLGS